MASKRIKAFNLLLKELKTKVSVPFKPVKNRLDMDDFAKLFTKQGILEKSEYPCEIQEKDKSIFWDYIQKMYICTISEKTERESFLSQTTQTTETTNSQNSLNLQNLVQELAPLINPEDIQNMFDPSELSDPAKMIAKMMDPNNEKMKKLSETVRPLLEDKINNGQINHQQITDEFYSFFS